MSSIAASDPLNSKALLSHDVQIPEKLFVQRCDRAPLDSLVAECKKIATSSKTYFDTLFIIDKTLRKKNVERVITIVTTLKTKLIAARESIKLSTSWFGFILNYFKQKKIAWLSTLIKDITKAESDLQPQQLTPTPTPAPTLSPVPALAPAPAPEPTQFLEDLFGIHLNGSARRELLSLLSQNRTALTDEREFNQLLFQVLKTRYPAKQETLNRLEELQRLTGILLRPMDLLQRCIGLTIYTPLDYVYATVVLKSMNLPCEQRFIEWLIQSDFKTANIDKLSQMARDEIALIFFNKIANEHPGGALAIESSKRLFFSKPYHERIFDLNQNIECAKNFIPTPPQRSPKSLFISSLKLKLTLEERAALMDKLSDLPFDSNGHLPEEANPLFEALFWTFLQEQFPEQDTLLQSLVRTQGETPLSPASLLRAFSS